MSKRAPTKTKRERKADLPQALSAVPLVRGAGAPPPEPFATIVERVCTIDLRMFELNPGSKTATRPYVWGEAWPNDPPQEEAALYAVEVTLAEPGLPSRVLLRGRTPPFREEVRENMRRMMAALASEGRKGPAPPV